MRASSPSDGDEVRAFLAGDAGAFERLVDLYQRPILRLFQRLLGSDEEALDLFQESFLQVYRSLRELRDPGRFRSWLYQIAIRKARRRMLRRRLWPAGGLDVEPTASPPAGEPTAEAADELARVAAALALLPPRQREVVVLRHYESMAYAEIAQTLGISEEAARANHYQGLRRLRQELNVPEP